MTWAAQGQTVITNVEHVGDERVTLALENVTEFEALRTLLGRQPGYIAMPRRMDDAGTSAYARVMILGIQADRNRPLRSDAATVETGPDPTGRPALPVRRPMFGESSAAPTGTGDDSQGTRVPGVIARDPAAPMRPSTPSTSDSAASTGSRRPGTIDRPQALPPSLEPPHPEAR